MIKVAPSIVAEVFNPELHVLSEYLFYLDESRLASIDKDILSEVPEGYVQEFSELSDQSYVGMDPLLVSMPDGDKHPVFIIGRGVADYGGEMGIPFGIDMQNNRRINIKVNTQFQTHDNTIEKREQKIRAYLEELQNEKDSQKASSLIFLFKGFELSSELQVLGIKTKNMKIKETMSLIKKFDSELNFYYARGDTSRSNKYKGKIILGKEFEQIIKNKIKEEIQVLTGKTLEELYAIKITYNKKEISQKIQDLTGEKPSEKELENCKIGNDRYDYFKYLITKIENKRTPKTALDKFRNEYSDENFFEFLLNYYVKYEICAEIWTKYIEGDEKLKSESLDYYFKNWKDVKIAQRLIYGIIFDFRHPFSAQKIQLNEWLKYDLHHWLTAEGHDNKAYCWLAVLLTLPKDSKYGTAHPDITNAIENAEKVGKTAEEVGEEWENKISAILSKVFKGEVPNWKNIDAEKNFAKYQEMNEDIRKLISLFLLFSKNELMTKLDIQEAKLKFR